MKNGFCGAIIVVAAVWSGAAFGQPTPAPAFDAASMKPSPPPSHEANRGFYVGMKRDPGRVSYSYVPMKYLIGRAYGIDTQKIAGGPGWLDTEMYDVTGTFPVGTQNDQDSLMLQTLLAERCRLTAHRETKEEPVYAFTVAKGGPKLKPYDAANRGTGNRGSKGHFELHNITLTQLGNSLYKETGRFVVDLSGLTGTYDIVLDWTPADTPADDPKANGPSLFTAVQEQLGLRLEPQKGPVEFLVIDHVEKPSEN